MVNPPPPASSPPSSPSSRLGSGRSAGLSRNDRVALGFVALLLALPPIMLALGEPFYVTLTTRMLIYGLAAVSLDMILGYGGMVSFGHAAFVGIGGYVAGLLTWHGMMSEPVLFGLWSSGTAEALILWPLAMLVSAVAATAIGAICLRTGGVHFIMITLAFAQMIFFFFVSLEGYGGDDGLSLWYRADIAGQDASGDVSFYYVVLALLIVCVLFARILMASRFGLVIQGARQNEARLASLGVAVYRHKLLLFAIAGAIAGLAGALEVNQKEYVSPSLLHWTRSGELLIMVILGGMGSLYGPVLGAITFLALEHVLARWTEHWAVVFGPALILCVLFFRRGLWGVLSGRNRP